ncbi:alpha-glucosidase 2 [Cucumis melo var. makuwa]|uniref:Alpha-glucosidase 2 n=1 Tax=Cucumis melo var. makuwa TaxID=1194695 RepID=A0A5A7V5Y5_CUCMM|nr:alpha-glucosidase 2 [Cucumis melo var. makuwa]TYJ97830.1 alpha-glucosidase 2 [Cucumis melo var. makuwa]
MLEERFWSLSSLMMMVTRPLLDDQFDTVSSQSICIAIVSTRLEKGKKKLGKAAVNCQQLEGEKVLRLCKMLKRFLNIKEYRFKSKTPIELKGACWTGGIQWLLGKIEINGYDGYIGVEYRSAVCTEEYSVSE